MNQLCVSNYSFEIHYDTIIYKFRVALVVQRALLGDYLSMTRMDYIIGMLWARGSLKVINTPYMKIEIGIRDVSQWQIDILKVLKEGKFTSEELVKHPTISPYSVTSVEIEKFLNSKTRLKIPIVEKTKREKWKASDIERFNKFLEEKEHDKRNFQRCRGQIEEMEKRLRGDFREIYPSSGRLDFNIRTSSFQIRMDPYLMEQLVSEYNLPRGPGELELYWRMSSIPKKISEGNRRDPNDFLRGVADVCGTLEGNTPRGRDARIKFDIKNNVTDEDKYQATVRKSVNLCNFLQEKMGIPVQGNYVSLRSNARPHKLKIWIRDLADNSEMPLWRMKIHYQQRFNMAMSRTSMPKSKFCCSLDDTGPNSIQGIQRWLQGLRKKEPSIVRCIRYCPKLQSQLKRVSLDNLESLISHISRMFKESTGEEIP